MVRYFCVLLLSLFFSLESYPDSSPPGCYNDLINHFFDAKPLTEALSMNQDISQMSWISITNDLKNRSAEIQRIMREKTKRMQPNPLKRPFDAEQVEKMLDDVLYQIFSGVLRNYQIDAEFQVRQVYEALKYKHQAAWRACFDSHRAEKAVIMPWQKKLPETPQ